MTNKPEVTSSLLKPLHLLGGGSLPDRVLPAPMEGILTPLFTKALSQQGHVKAWITPFYRVGVGNPPRLHKLRREIQFFLDTQLPVIVQLMGTDPELMSLVAERFNSIEGVVGLNFNFACPSKRVNHRGGGGACLQTPDLMASILDSTRKRCPNLSLSAKIRTGFIHPEECLDILPKLKDAGCEWVTVHHRTVKEAYTKVDERIPRLTKAREAWGSLPFFASGDIFGVEDALALEASGCCEGLVVARGLIRKPLLLGEIRKALDDPQRYHRGDHDQRKQAYQFMEQLLELCIQKPDIYWSHKYCMELARNLFGVKNSTFRTLTTLKQIDGPGPLLEKLILSKEQEHLLDKSC